MSLSVGQLRTQVRSALAKARVKQRDAGRLGFYAPSGWSGPSDIEIDKTLWRIADARSPLAARELLAGAPPSERLLLVCRVAEEELGGDLMARFGVPRLLRPNPAETLKDQFQAASIDPRILANLALVDVLSEHAPEQGFPPVANGHLTAEHFWGQLLSRVWGMSDGKQDLIGLLRWTLDPASSAKLRRSTAEFRSAAEAWIEQSAGGAAGDVLRSIAEADNPRPIVLGLACGVLFDALASREAPLVQARVRLERYLGHQAIAPDHARLWSSASLAVMSSLAIENATLARTLGRELDEFLGLLHVAAYASLSTWSQAGLEVNFERLGLDLQRFIKSPARAGLGALFRSIDALRSSRLADHQVDRISRCEMAVRLCSWLQTTAERPSEDLPRSLPDAVERYLLDESFVDWARASLFCSDPSPALAEAMRQLLQSVAPHRNKFNEIFAGMLSAWTPSQDTVGRLTPIYKVLSKIVAPAGDASPVLLLVLDGMSAAVFDELVADLGAHGWRSISSGASRPLILSGVPSITELSRTSLLSGRLQLGGQPEELAGFGEVTELRQRSRSGSPRLFHKGSLTSAGDGNLSQDVVEAIASSRRFVGVVINAIDDHLAKGEQLAVAWKAERIRPLPSLMARARDAGRLVIIMSDHGHLLDQGTQKTTGSESDRYRPADPAPADGEVLIHPAHTGLGVDPNGIVLAWSESLRYCGRKNGYHGGVSPQETVVPLAMLCHGSNLPPGWIDSPVLPPAWWHGELQSVIAVSASPRASASAVSTLFETPAVEATAVRGPDLPPWLERLLQTDLFKTQRARAGRNVPSSKEVSRFVVLMLSRGGKLTRPALARALNLPELRVGGYVSQIRRILNVEGYPIIHVHEESATVELNEPLLRAQFDVT